MKKSQSIAIICILLFVVVFFIAHSHFSAVTFVFVSPEQKLLGATSFAVIPEAEIKPVTHIAPPHSLKAIYMTSWTAGSKNLRDKIIKIADETEVNSIVIDIKDYTGNLSFEPTDPVLRKMGAYEKRIRDIRELISELHEKNIYVIGRIASFQDPAQVKLHPEWAVKKKSDRSVVWKDYKGISWLDVGASEFWDQLVAIGKESYAQGFDELNFDYIRFPSDGNMNDIFYPRSQDKVKSVVLREFFAHLAKAFEGSGAVLSADLFGMTTTNREDLNIGQILEYALPYFDYVSPMVYPSHYPTGFMGFKNPAAHPYDVVKYSMDKAVVKAENASTSPLKIRPWLQDFNLGATYTEDMVRQQKQAVYDAGLTSWMMWSASNRYTLAAYDKDQKNESTTVTSQE